MEHSNASKHAAAKPVPNVIRVCLIFFKWAMKEMTEEMESRA